MSSVHLRSWLLVPALLLTMLAVPASAQDSQALNARALSATCANCHGSEGSPPRGSALAPLAGMPSAQFLARMKSFKQAGAGPTVMHQIAQGFTDTQVEQMATYFAAQKRF